MFKGSSEKNLFPSFIFICLVSLMVIGLWNINILLPPLTVLFSILLIRLYRKSKSKVTIKKIDVGVLIIVVAETLVFFFSSYQNNSTFFIIKVITILLFYVSYSIISNDGFNHLLKSYLAGYGVILSLGTFVVFLLFRTDALQIGVTKLSDVKHLYTPFGQISNDWSTLLLFFLAFISYQILKNENEQGKQQWWLLPGFMFCLFGILHTFSRGAYLALFVFVVSLVVLILINKLIALKQLAIGITVLVGSIFILSLTAKDSFYATLKLNQSISQKRSVEGRFAVWKGAGNMIADYPITGVGSNNFALQYQAYMDDSNDSAYTARVNNSYLQILVEKGIIGILAYSVLVFQLLAIIFKKVKCKHTSSAYKLFSCVVLSILLALGLKEFTFSSFFEQGGLMLGFFIITALFRRDSELLTEINAPYKTVLSSFVIIIILLIGINYKYFVIKYAENAHNKAVEAIKQHDYSKGIQLLNKSIQFNPNQAIYYIHKAVALELNTAKAIPSIEANKISTTSDLLLQAPAQTKNKIISHYEKALQLFPKEARAHHNLAWIMLSDDNNNKALHHMRKALKYAPSDHCYWVSYGLMLNHVNAASKADKAFEQAVLLSPEITSSKLWKQVIGNHTDRQMDIINNVKRVFKHKIESNPIYKARYVRMIMNSDSSGKAMHYLQEVNEALPSLNRSWLNLGFLYFYDNKMSDAADCFNKAAFLDGNDYLPNLALAMYSERDYNLPEAIQYYKKALKLQLSKMSDYDHKIMKTYGGKATLQTLMPYTLWQGINPQYFPRKLCKKIMSLYEKIGMEQKAIQYKTLMNKNHLSIRDVPIN